MAYLPHALLAAGLLLAGALQASDEGILAARKAAQRGDVKALAALRARTAGHPLAAYPAYWHLVATLDDASPEEVRRFLAENADGPLADQLRREWLKKLGATEQWELFREEHAAFAGTDAEVACHALRERILRDDAQALTEARALWLEGREAPPACTPVFMAASDARLIGSPEVWERMRKLLAANRLADVRRANALLPAPERLNEKALDRAQANPGRYLAGEKSRIPTRATHELLLYGIIRLARTSPEEAAAHLESHAKVLGEEDARYGWAQVGKAAAQRHDQRALEWFAKAGDGPFTDDQLAWRARAALRAGDWDEVRTTINRMPPALAQESAWRYWLARALAAKGNQAAAEALLRPLAGERHFYGILAAEDLGAADPPDWTAREVPRDDVERIRGVPAVSRALALYRLELNAEAFREWVHGLRGADDRDCLAASEVALQAGLVDRSIGIADRTRTLHDFTRRYPIPHREALAEAARRWNVDEALLFGLIRQESRFNAAIRSRVGATGLMQLMPATARWVAKEMPVAAYRPTLLVQPETNIAMGTYYFHRVLADLGDPVLAMAGYNAGPGRAKRWRDAGGLEGAIYAESIPFDETRDYVKKVTANAWHYAHRLTGRTASLKAMMGTVPGRATGESTNTAAIP